MGLKEVLEKMKIVEGDASAAPPPVPHVASRSGAPPPPPLPKPSARHASMEDVLKSVPPPAKIDEKALSAVKDGGDVPDFVSIYRAAGVKEPAHGFSAYKIL